MSASLSAQTATSERRSARLAPATLASVPAHVVRPAYAREHVGVGIVHLGVGAFHRAHQAEYTDDAIAAGGGDWRILGVSLRQPAVRDQLAPQDGLYTLVTRSAGAEGLRIVGALAGVRVAPEDPRAVLEAMAAPEIRIVSLTVTEKGYCHDPASGRLNEAHPDIRADLREPEHPRSALGFLAGALALRRARGVEPFTVLCCDNLPSNGQLVRALVLELAERIDAALTRWIEAHVAFPATMVDRIVPATTDQDLRALEAQLDVRDEGMVKTEPFRQWVIEDRFCAGHPAWEQAGAQLVADVQPFEEAKLRLLNGSHSTLAYLGRLAGCELVHEAMAVPAFARVVERLMALEVTPTLRAAPGMALETYRAALLDRFRNAALEHRCRQIAMDGSQKLPQRLLGTIRDNLAAGRAIDTAALSVAAWMRYVSGVDERGARIDVQDPLAERLREIFERVGPRAEALTREYLGVREIFGADLAESPPFVSVVTRHLASLFERGARATATAFLEGM
jgi:fructuronate reductase